MQCSECSVEMEKGVLDANGRIWADPEKLPWWAKTKLIPLVKIVKKVVAWRCPECKKVDLRTED